MWQYIIVYIIGALIAFFVVRKIYRAFWGRKKEDDDPCKGCPGCGKIN